MAEAFGIVIRGLILFLSALAEIAPVELLFGIELFLLLLFHGLRKGNQGE